MHAAFVAAPAHGHVNAALPMVEELLRRGHRVSFATGDALIPVVATTGARTVSLPCSVPDTLTTAEYGPDDIAAMLEHFLDQAPATLQTLRHHFADDCPDVVCYEMFTAEGRILAAQLDVRDVCLIPTFASNEHFSLANVMTRDDFDHTHPRLVAASRALDEFAATHGVPGEQPDPMLEAPAPLNLAFLPREFQPAGDTFDERVRFVGPTLGSRAADTTWQPPRADAPVLFASLGTVFNRDVEFFRTCIRAFADTGWHVVLAVGGIDPAALGTVPDNVELHDFVPQPAVLRHTTVFLTHAGMNSTMEAVASGVPMVAVPQTPEQDANARRAEKLGLARVLQEHEHTPAAVRAAVDTIAADTAVHQNLTWMQQAITAAGGAAAAADALEGISPPALDQNSPHETDHGDS